MLSMKPHPRPLNKIGLFASCKVRWRHYRDLQSIAFEPIPFGSEAVAGDPADFALISPLSEKTRVYFASFEPGDPALVPGMLQARNNFCMNEGLQRSWSMT